MKSATQRILVWHQGALGDLLLAGPALAAVSRHYPQARFTGLGQPERWGLLSLSLPVDEVWDSGEARWAALFSPGDLPPELWVRLARFHLALVFSPRPPAILLEGLRRAGIPQVSWLPSFEDAGEEPVAALQARHLAEIGLHYIPAPFRLKMEATPEEELSELPGPGPWLAVAPGSGQPRKNWPLAHYYELSRALGWDHGLKVVWLAGPAEGAMAAYLEALARAQGQVLLSNRPLIRVARVLSRCRLYIGNDSGLTHLAAAAGTPGVLALFGPTDPRVWAPLGPGVRVITAPCALAPCASGREIACPEAHCLQDLAPETVQAEADRMLAVGGSGNDAMA